MKVLAAMSGGVDSAVAAARAVEFGHDVTGVHFALSATPATDRTGSRGCCTLSDARDARRAADTIGIPFYVWDLAERFQEEVVADFIAEYAAGRTPNPCVRCNERIKFAAVLDRALDLGFDAVVTGHYARITAETRINGETGGGFALRRAVDAAKDQSYVLAVVAADLLAHVVLPLGDSSKTDVRDEAEQRGLAVARKPDSHDICFIPDGDTRGWLRNQMGTRPGPIVEVRTGAQVGEHDGAHGFTIGQRRGLALGRPAPDGAPRYVVGVDAAANTVFVGPPTLLDVDVLEGDAVVWLEPAWPGTRSGLAVQVRAHGQPVPAAARAIDSGSGIVIETETPLRAVAAGQTAVLYDGDRVVASTTINRSRRRAAVATAP